MLNGTTRFKGNPKNSMAPLIGQDLDRCDDVDAVAVWVVALTITSCRLMPVRNSMRWRAGRPHSALAAPRPRNGSHRQRSGTPPTAVAGGLDDTALGRSSVPSFSRDRMAKWHAAARASAAPKPGSALNRLRQEAQRLAAIQVARDVVRKWPRRSGRCRSEGGLTTHKNNMTLTA